MKVLKTLALIATIFCLFSLVSCSSDDEPIPTRSQLLAGTVESGRSYFISSAEIDLDELNGTLVLDECVTDNTIVYYPSGQYEENEGRTKCNVEDPTGSTGIWTIINNETQISIELNGDIEIWDIININDGGHSISRVTEAGELTFVLERFL